jgi:hypothetical protein
MVFRIQRASVVAASILSLTAVFSAKAGGVGGVPFQPGLKFYNAVTGMPVVPLRAPVLGADLAGGVTVAAGDLNGDGVSDLVVGGGPGGGPRVRAFSGATGATLMNFLAYAPTQRGGVRVSLKDLDGDTKLDIITAPEGAGSGVVNVFSGANGALMRSFQPFPNYTGGVNVAAGDINGDGVAEIVASPGPGGGPNVRIFDVSSPAVTTQIGSFQPYTFDSSRGVTVAVGDVTGDGRDDIVTGADVRTAGAGPGGGPHVKVFDGTEVLRPTGGGSFFDVFVEELPSDPWRTVGVSTGDTNGDGRSEVFMSISGTSGLLLPAIQKRTFNPATGMSTPDYSFDPTGGTALTSGPYGFESTLANGIFVGRGGVPLLVVGSRFVPEPTSLLVLGAALPIALLRKRR